MNYLQVLLFANSMFCKFTINFAFSLGKIKPSLISFNTKQSKGYD